MRYRFFWTFLGLGLVSIVAQIIFLRELMVSFYGNEFFLGLALGFWLFWTALGSLIGKRQINRQSFLVNLFRLVFLLPLTLVFIRFLKSLFPFGSLINFAKAVGLTFILLAPVGFCLGVFFSRAFFKKEKKPAFLASQAYLIETLGFAFGGLVFTFFLIKFSSFGVLILASLALLALAFFVSEKKSGPLLLMIVFLLLLFKIPWLEKTTRRFQFANLVETQNSIYGQVSVTQRGGQYNFFESGALIGINQKTEASEYLIHPTLLQHPDPQAVLMIGGGLAGPLGEILKHQPEKIDYVELDPILIKTIRKYLGPELLVALADPRVNLVHDDPKRFLQKTKESYDVVIINLPPPATALINRLYTQEAYQAVGKILKPGGILAVNLNLPTDYLSDQSRSLAASIFQALNQEFSQSLLLPEHTLLFLTSHEPVLTVDDQVLSQRMVDREIKTDFVSPAYLKNRLTDDRIKMFSLAVKTGRANQDFFPIAYFHQIAFNQGLFNSDLARVLSFLPKMVWPISLLIMFIFLLAFVRRPRLRPVFILALTGATIMVWEVALIFAFQIKLGYIYHQIGFLMAAFLAGMSLGNHLALKNLNFKKHFKPMVWFLISFSLLLPFCLKNAANVFVFFVLTFTAGTFTGTIFPLVNKGFLKQRKQIGLFYGADLMGSFFGAVLVSLFFIPLLGLEATLYSLAIPFLVILVIL